MPRKGSKAAKPSFALNTVYHGHARDVLKTFPDEVIDCVVSSPPYFQQRNYDGDDQIGQETSPEDYVQSLVEVFGEVRRTLKETGALWLVLGDKYLDGELLGLPWQVALALRADGWKLRSDVIWHKPNAMPSSVKTRPTTDHEYVFLLVKNNQYFYDADAIREPHVTFSENSKMKGGRNHFHRRGSTPEAGKNGGNNNLHDARWDQAFHPKGRNKRTVWSIPLSKFRDAHFAVFPETLVETCINATCPEDGTVLDPFFGSGTTGVVAKRLGRSYVGIDQSEKYVEMAKGRLAETNSGQLSLPGLGK
ncbi:DNA-methyltransferase [Bremerella sp.]|uniref:DNA-methyltransferase n=1 Tax=Bremerella sp. TaxID=2795602 RepID=UPI00391916D7